MLGSTTKHGRTILQFAAQSGSKEGFEAVLDTVKATLPSDKVDSESAAKLSSGNSHEQMVLGYRCSRLRFKMSISLSAPRGRGDNSVMNVFWPDNTYVALSIYICVCVYVCLYLLVARKFRWRI